MRPEELLDSMEYIDTDLIEKADQTRRKGRRSPARWGALAACLCLVAAGVFAWQGHRRPAEEEFHYLLEKNTLQHWSETMAAEDYFTFSGAAAVQNSASLVMSPFAVPVSLDGERDALEAEGVLPAVPGHPEHSFEADFNGDGSLYKVSFLWMRRGEGREAYSDLQLTAAPKELHEVSDVITVYTDESGNVIVPGVTATERDGVYIYAEGAGRSKKTLTWQTAQGWYQLSGLNWSGDVSELVSLLDWFWAHPLNLERFAALGKETVRFSSREEYPEAFAAQVPDFSALGYTPETERVSFILWEGAPVPVWLEGSYMRGETFVRWSVGGCADRDAWEACLGRPREITEEKISEALKKGNSFTVFLDGPYMAALTMERGGAVEAWEIVQALR